MLSKYLLNTVLRAVVLIIAANSSFALANEKIQNELLTRITQSQKELQELEKSTSQKSYALTKRLDEKQAQIATLRKEAASAQRMIDEQLLSLDQLKTRVERWDAQSNYQAHLLNAYVESINLPVSELPKTDGEITIDASILDVALDHLESRLTPQWKEQDIISTQGTLVNVKTLSLGPVKVAYDSATQTGGPLSSEKEQELRVLDVMDRAQRDDLREIQETGHGYLTFDPTLGNAYELMNHSDSLESHLMKGGIWVLPILLFGLLAFIIAVLKAVELFKLPKIDMHITEKIGRVIAEFTRAENDTDIQSFKNKILHIAKDAGGAQDKLIQIALNTPISQRRDDLLVAYLMEHKYSIERFMGIVATSAAIAPLLGLLGTVSGMISMFKMMTIFGSGDASTVSGGISEALITTELGLIVAIPSLIVSALLTRKTKSYNHMLETLAIKLSKIKFNF